MKRLDMKNVVKDYSKRYRKARKKEKFEILEEYTVPLKN